MIGTSAIVLLTIFISFIFFLFSRPANRGLILLIVSIAFAIALNGKWASIILSIVLINYFVTRMYGKYKFIRLVLIVLNIGAWATLKTGNEYSWYGWTLIFPLGFSIFIFQQLTYLLKDNCEKRISLTHFSLYSLFFGNIATGPIFDFSEFREQFKKKIYLNSDEVYLGMIIFLLGFAKKIIFADSFSELTIFLFDTKRNYGGSLLFPFLLNKYEIYMNFLAFSEMAIGISLIFGFKLRPNFNRPFATTSIANFWKRWHIALVDWIRTYVFYPLLVSPVARLGAPFILMITFLIFALWHGFTINHILYGLIQFILVFLDSRFGHIFYVNKHYKKARFVIVLKWLFFYVFLISIPGLIFRSDGLENVGRILTNLIQVDWRTSWEIFSFTKHGFVLIVSIIFVNELLESRLDIKKIARYIKEASISLKLLFFFLYLTIIFIFGVWDEVNGFVYSRY